MSGFLKKTLWSAIGDDRALRRALAIDGLPLANHGIRRFTTPGWNAADDSD